MKYPKKGMVVTFSYFPLEYRLTKLVGPGKNAQISPNMTQKMHQTSQ